MKTRILTIILFTGTVLFSFAQSDKQADDILKGVSAKYKSFTSIKAEFVYTIDNPHDKKKETQSGNVLLQGDKFKLEILGQEVISDGKTKWTYLKESNEVQISEPEKKEDAITPSNIFTMYEKGFEFKFLKDSVEAGKTYSIIDIMPVDKKKNFFKIRLTIDKSDKLIVSTMVFEKSGNRNTYTIKKFTPNPPIPQNTFAFDKTKHPGVEVVDLR